MDTEESTTDDNQHLAIWDAVSKTDIEHTKEVSFGRKFTAIDAHSQVMNATKQFGPIGQGWGYENFYGEVHLQDGRIMVWCDVTLWYMREGEQWEGVKGKSHRQMFGPIRGGAMLVGFDSKGKLKAPDTDAPKKASTDGLTKALSHLGFNADVFLGMFDDSKYVQELQKEKDQATSAAVTEYEQTRAGFIEKIQACKKSKDIDACMADYKLWIDRLVPSKGVEIRAWVEKTRSELNGSK